MPIHIGPSIGNHAQVKNYVNLCREQSQYCRYLWRNNPKKLAHVNPFAALSVLHLTQEPRGGA